MTNSLGSAKIVPVVGQPSCPADHTWTGIEVVITALTRNQVVAQAARGFESHPVRQLQGFCYEQKPCFFMSSLKKFPHGHLARLTAPDNADNDDIGSRYFGRNVAISHGIDGFAFKKRSCVRTHQKNRIVYSNTLCRKADPRSAFQNRFDRQIPSFAIRG